MCVDAIGLLALKKMKFCMHQQNKHIMDISAGFPSLLFSGSFLPWGEGEGNLDSISIHFLPSLLTLPTRVTISARSDGGICHLEICRLGMHLRPTHLT